MPSTTNIFCTYRNYCCTYIPGLVGMSRFEGLTGIAGRFALLAVCFTLYRPGIAYSNPTVGHVIQISVDGLSGSRLADLVENQPLVYKNFKRIVDQGAVTFNARTDFANTRTLPNHTSMLTGRPVLQPAGMPDTTQHGWTLNSLSANSTVTLHDPRVSRLEYVASTFDVAHDNGLSTALFTGKGKFILFDNSYNATSGRQDEIGVDNGRDKIDTFVVDSSIGLQDRLVTDMQAANFNYIFLHYADPDGAGHDFGWGSPEWNLSVQAVDGYLGGLLDLIDTNANLQNDTAIILTADHGGTELRGHSDPTNPINFTIPVMVWGPGVTAGADLYSLNTASRLDPGTASPSYTAAGQPIRNGGTGNLALDLLGLDPIPGTLIDGQHDLSVVPEPATVVLLFFYVTACLGYYTSRGRSSCREFSADSSATCRI